MVGYRERPRARNAVRADVWLSLNAPQPMRLLVYRQRGAYFAMHPEDEYTFARVEK